KKNFAFCACVRFSTIQACRIQNFFDTAISTLGFCPIDNVLSMAHRIGQIHFYRGVNFEARDWLAFKNVAVKQITKDLIKRDCTVALTENGVSTLIVASVDAWKKFMVAIIREMKRG
ncbi:hypothetical protein Angca_000545, partial [Angiostrongylus cantonensis]